MRRSLLALVLSVSVFGCATVFRSGKEKVHVESDPTGAELKKGEKTVAQTPTDIEVDRTTTTAVVLQKQGYGEHRGVVKRQLSAGWLTLDLITCLPLLCIPFLVDAISGAWYDVDPKYKAFLTPQKDAPPTASGTAAASSSAGTSASATPPSPTATASPGAGMSESERKATARAAYIEGVGLQEKGNCPAALPRFETAQKLYEAPTHLLHMAQCQAAMGKLVEASESYESLARANLGPQAPDVFRQAQEEAKRELPQLKPRVPTLRINITPAPTTLSNLVVRLNSGTMPNELLGIARPVNPGPYKVTVSAKDYKEASKDIEVREGKAEVVDLTLKK
jgi:hypothetical protein